MSKRPHRFTTTGGSDEREARSLIAPLLGFNLAEEASRLRAESAYIDGDRNARTLVKAGAFRLVLLAFRKGASFDESDQRGTFGTPGARRSVDATRWAGRDAGRRQRGRGSPLNIRGRQSP